MATEYNDDTDVTTANGTDIESEIFGIATKFVLIGVVVGAIVLILLCVIGYFLKQSRKNEGITPTSTGSTTDHK